MLVKNSNNALFIFLFFFNTGLCDCHWSLSVAGIHSGQLTLSELFPSHAIVSFVSVYMICTLHIHNTSIDRQHQDLRGGKIQSTCLDWILLRQNQFIVVPVMSDSVITIVLNNYTLRYLVNLFKISLNINDICGMNIPRRPIQTRYLWNYTDFTFSYQYIVLSA